METVNLSARSELGDLLVGRDDDLVELRSWLESSGRLFTVTGPPGVGKTCLCRCGANEARTSGTRVVALSLHGASSPEDLYAELARTIEVALPAGVDVDSALTEALSELGTCLLWLDELRGSAVGIVSLVGDWLDACPELRVLVSSQERLRLPEERVHVVRPLDTPVSPCATLESPAIAMWVDCVRRFSPGYRPDDEEVQRIAAIVRALDGLPLAIELTAARMELLDAVQILDRLSRDAAPKTLRSAICWAWSHLEQNEESVLSQCSVFRGGFTVEAAEAVLEFPAESVRPLDMLQALREKSLLRVNTHTGSGRRLRLLHAVNELGQEQLRAQGGWERAAARHAAHYAARAEALLERPSTEASFRALMAERENLLAVVNRWLDAESGGTELAAAGSACLLALEPLFWAHGYRQEHHVLLERAVAAADALPVDRRAEVWRMRAGGLCHAGEHRKAVAAYEVALGLLPADDQARGAGILGEVSAALAAIGQLHGAQWALKRALAVASSDEIKAPLRVRMGALLRETGQLDEAASYLVDALDTCRRTEDVVGEVTASIQLGKVLASRGAYAEAAARFRHARAHASQTGHDYLIGYADLSAGLAAHDAGERSAARQAYEQARAGLRRVKARRDEGFSLAHLAWLDLEEGQTERATLRAELALRILEASGNVRCAALVRARLAVIEAALGWRDAAAADVERAVEVIDSVNDPCLGAALTLHGLHARLLLAGAQAGDVRAECGRHLASTSALAERSSEVRMARRALELALGEQGVEPDATEALPDQVLRVGPDARWFALGEGAVVSLARRGAQRRLLHHLVLARQAEPGTPLSVYDLFDAGWPGQTISPEHSANRVYNALFELRRQGLRRAIVREDGGYLLDPALRLQLEELSEEW